jgi:hypothetical protein
MSPFEPEVSLGHYHGAGENDATPCLGPVQEWVARCCGSKGILLGQRDLKFLERMYAVYFIAVPYRMLQVKKADRTGFDVGLNSVWNIFLGYQLFRMAAWVGRLAWLQRRTDQEADLAATNDLPVPAN